MASLDLATLSIKIKADGAQAVQEIQKVEKTVSDASKKVKTDWADVGKQLTDIGSNLSKKITLPLVAAGTACVKLASDLTETVGKTEVVFGDMSDAVMEWSNTSVTSMGLAQETALNMASAYGDMGTSMGLTVGQSAEMAMSLTRLAADMASFKNISVERANVALQSVFTGETESLKAMGIVMTETNLEQFAMNEGITTTYKQMSQTEKVMLRYRYVMAMTANAQGDFARTGDSLANQTRKLGENIKQLGTSFGQILEPAITGIVSTINNVVTWLNNLDDGTKRVILTIAEIAAAIPMLVLTVGTIITTITKLQAAIAMLAANPVVATIIGITAAVAGLAVVIGNLATSCDTSSEAVDRVRAKLAQHLQLTVESNVPEKLDELDALAAGLQNNYSASIAIDGDTLAAQEAVANLRATIAETETFIKIGGDEAQAEEKRKKLAAAIDATQGIVGIGADAEAANAELANLRAQATDLKVSVGIEVDRTQEQIIDELITKTETLKGDKTAIGKFVVEPGAIESVDEYVMAIAGATVAVTDFDDAVANIDAIYDRMAAEQKAANMQKMYADSLALHASLVAGTISEEQYYRYMENVARQCQEANVAVDRQNNLLKENSARYNDGAEDISDWGKIFDDALSLAGEANVDFSISSQQAAASIQALADGTGTAEDGAIAWTFIQQDNARATQQAVDVQNEYNSSLETAKKNMEETKNYCEQSAEQSYVLSDAYESIAISMEQGRDASRFFNKTLQEYPELARQMIRETGASVDKLNPYSDAAREAAEGNDEMKAAIDMVAEGMENGLSPTEALLTAMEQFPEVAALLPETLGATFTITANDADAVFDLAANKYDEAEAFREQAKQADADYQAEQKAAYEKYVADMGSITTTYTAEEVAAIAQMCEDNNIILDEAQVNAQVSAAAMPQVIAEEIGKGTPDAAERVSNMVNVMCDKADELKDGGITSGKEFVNGMMSGLDIRSGALYRKVRNIVNNAISAAKNAADIHSPSRKTNELIGKPFIEGIGVGMEDAMPKLLREVQAHTRSILTAGKLSAENVSRSLNSNSMRTAGTTTINQTNNFASRALTPFEETQQINRLNRNLAEVFE